MSVASARAAQVTPLRPNYGEVGTPGTRVTGGRIWDYEKNRKLQGDRWVAVCEEMRRTDPAVYQNCSALKQTLLSARWRVMPPPDVPERYGDMVVRASAYVAEALGLGRRGRLRGGWEGFLREALEFLFLGWRYFEEIYEVADGKVWIKRFAGREPSAHAQWHFDDAGELSGVEQVRVDRSRGGRAPIIPAHKILLLTLDRTGGNVEGLGTLRPCHYWYELKRHATDMLAVALERWAVPTPIVVSDRERLIAAGWDDVEIKKAIAEAKRNAKDLTSHQLGYLATTVGIDYEVFGEAAFDPSKADAVVNLCDEQMAAAFLLGFLRLGVNDTGSRSVGQTQETFFGRACVNLLDLVAATVSGPAGPGSGTVGRLLRWNFPSLPEALYPTIEHDGLTESPLLWLATSGGMAGLIAAGQWTPDDETEAALRHQVRAPALAQIARRSPTMRLGRDVSAPEISSETPAT